MLLLLLQTLPAAPAEPAPSFGADASAGFAAGGLFGEWPVPGLHGAFTARYDAFVQDRDAAGPRVGLSIFAATTTWPLQQRVELQPDGTQDTAPFGYVQYGLLAAVRPDPSLRWGGLFSVGFSRLDLEDWYGGVQAVPMLLGEAGARRRLDSEGRWYADALLRAGWGQARGADSDWTDWWLLQAVLSAGLRSR